MRYLVLREHIQLLILTMTGIPLLLGDAEVRRGVDVVVDVLPSTAERYSEIRLTEE